MESFNEISPSMKTDRISQKQLNVKWTDSQTTPKHDASSTCWPQHKKTQVQTDQQ